MLSPYISTKGGPVHKRITEDFTNKVICFLTSSERATPIPNNCIPPKVSEPSSNPSCQFRMRRLGTVLSNVCFFQMGAKVFDSELCANFWTGNIYLFF